MAVDITAVYTIAAPASVDGRGGVAIINGSTTATDYVGNLTDLSGFDGPEVRESADDIVQGDGGIHGSFYHGRRPFTMEIEVIGAATNTLSMERLDKLYRATNAMRADGTITWTEAGIARVLNFRRQQPPRGPSVEKKCLFSGVSADPRIYSAAALPSASPLTNAGNVGSPPTFTFTSGASGVVDITNTTSGLGSPKVRLNIGASGLAASTVTTVDFNAKTVTQAGIGGGGTASKYAAVDFLTSTWWEVVPGANTWTVSNASSVSISVRSAWL